VWKAMEAKARKIEMGETKGGRKKKTRRKKTRRKITEEEKKTKRKRTMEVKKVVEKWEIWNKEEEVEKSEEEAKKLVLKHFYKWICVFWKETR